MRHQEGGGGWGGWGVGWGGGGGGWGGGELKHTRDGTHQELKLYILHITNNVHCSSNCKPQIIYPHAYMIR